jgi:hypothetical protein
MIHVIVIPKMKLKNCGNSVFGRSRLPVIRIMEFPQWNHS